MKTTKLLLCVTACLGLAQGVLSAQQPVPESITRRFGPAARPVIVSSAEDEVDESNLIYGPDLKTGGQILDFAENQSPRKKAKEMVTIAEGTTLNRAISNLADMFDLGYTPSPMINDVLVETARLPMGDPTQMVNTLIAPYGFRAIVNNHTIEVFGKNIDDTQVMQVMTYKLKNVRFGEIAEAPQSAMISTAGIGGTGGSDAGAQSAGGGGGKVLAPQDLAAANVQAFFEKISGVVQSGKPGSSLTYDPRTRTIVAKDLPPYLTLLRRYLDEFDRPQRKVAVHFRMVAVSHNPSRKQGIDYSKLLGEVQATVGQTVNATTVTDASAGILQSVGAITFTGFNSPGRNNLALSVPELTATLNFIRKYADVELLHDTFLVAQDGMSVHKFVGQKLFIVVPGTPSTGAGTSSGPQTFQPMIGDTITFHPEVAENGEITASLKIESSSEAESRQYANENYPQFAVNETQQFITARDGQTVMLSGSLKDVKTNNRSDIPLLSDIPIIGPRLFGSNTSSRNHAVALMLLTMQIIEPGDSDAETRLAKATSDYLASDPRMTNAYVPPEYRFRKSSTGLDTKDKQDIPPQTPTSSPFTEGKPKSSVPVSGDANAPKKQPVSILRSDA